MRRLVAWFHRWWPSVKHFWTQTGVIPRWQLVAVYTLVIAVGVTGFLSLRDSRRDVIARTCHQQNARHDNAIAAIDRLIRTQHAGAKNTRAIQDREAAVTMINALAPRVDDCDALAERLVP